MTSKAFPYQIDAFNVLPRPDGTSRRAIDDYVVRSQSYGDELAAWLTLNAHGKWRRCLLEFGFVLMEDAAMFRLRVGDGSRVTMRLASPDSKSKLAWSRSSTEEATMAKGQKKSTKEAKKPSKKTKGKSKTKPDTIKAVLAK